MFVFVVNQREYSWCVIIICGQVVMDVPAHLELSSAAVRERGGETAYIHTHTCALHFTVCVCVCVRVCFVRFCLQWKCAQC